MAVPAAVMPQAWRRGAETEVRARWTFRSIRAPVGAARGRFGKLGLCCAHPTARARNVVLPA
jgi:hypothetical protein